jgi:hypothetical protein
MKTFQRREYAIFNPVCLPSPVIPESPNLMLKPAKIPPIVSQRNHFKPADELVTDALYRLPDQFKHPDFEVWLVTYTETVIKNVAANFGMAAQRGIEQTAELLCDPSFYEKKRKDRAVWTKKMKEERAKDNWARNERSLAPTAEQIEDQIKAIGRALTYHLGAAAKAEVDLARLRALAPSNIQIQTTIVQ